MFSQDYLTSASGGIAIAVTGIAAVSLASSMIWRRSRHYPPGPPQLPIVGNWFDLPSTEPWVKFADWSEHYQSDLIHLNVFGTHILVVNSAEVAKALFEGKSALYGDRPRMTMLNELVGLSWLLGFIPQGDTWKTHRKILANNFNPASVSQFRPHQLKWRNIFLQNLLKTPDEFFTHIQHLASGLSLDLVFGLDVASSGEPDPFIHAANEVVDGLAATGIFGTYLLIESQYLRLKVKHLPFGRYQHQAKHWKTFVDIAITVPLDMVKADMATEREVRPSIASRLVQGGVFAQEDIRKTTSLVKETVESCRSIVVLADGVLGVLTVPPPLATFLASLPAASPVVYTSLAAFGLVTLCRLVLPIVAASRRAMAALPAAVIAPDAREEEYTFPKKDGSTFKAKIMSMHVPELKALCGQVGQPRSGIKTVLQERLKAYSSSPDLWKLLQPGARRSHKGSHICQDNPTGMSSTAEKKPAKKKSAYTKRREALFGDSEDSGPIQRSKDMRTEQEKKEMLDWAAEMSKEFIDFQTPREVTESEPLYPTPAVREKKIEAQLSAILDFVRTGYTPGVSEVLHAASFQPPTTLGQVTTPTIVSGVDLQCRLIAAPSQQVNIESLPITTLSSKPSASPLSAPAPFTDISPVQSPQQLPLTIAPTKTSSTTKEIILANGTHIRFVSSDVPDPILVSFSDDIPKLVRMWDDAAPGYIANECLLKIKGYGIPLRLWEQAYKYGGDGRWKGTKDKWGKWKFVVEAYNQLGKDAFWAKYHDTKTNKPMSYTAIVESLRVERKANDALVSARLISHFGDNFKDKFGYRGQQLVRPSAIAKRSRMLNDE
ncbi:cytochrome P450 [Lentinula edodes]|nr:cytochrome P450 [Lentinula edodes]